MPQPKNSMRQRAWKGADDRHNYSLPPEERNSRKNELLDHYSVGADIAGDGGWRGVLGSVGLGALQELVGRPVLSRYPDLGNKLMPDTFNFKTPTNNRPGAIDPYKKPTFREAAENLALTGMGALDKYPRIRKMFGYGDE